MTINRQVVGRTGPERRARRGGNPSAPRLAGVSAPDLWCKRNCWTTTRVCRKTLKLLPLGIPACSPPRSGPSTACLKRTSCPPTRSMPHATSMFPSSDKKSQSVYTTQSKPFSPQTQTPAAHRPDSPPAGTGGASHWPLGSFKHLTAAAVGGGQWAQLVSGAASSPVHVYPLSSNDSRKPINVSAYRRYRGVLQGRRG